MQSAHELTFAFAPFVLLGVIAPIWFAGRFGVASATN